MNKKNVIFLVVAIVIFVIAICIFVYANVSVSNDDKNDENETIVGEDEVKEFVFYDDEYNKYGVDYFEGEPTTIILWSSDTENSFEVVELIEDIYDEYKEDITFLVINTNEPDEDIMEVMEKCGYPFEVYYDLDNVVADYYSCSTLPTLVFIDAYGEILNTVESDITEDSLLANLELLLIDEDEEIGE